MHCNESVEIVFLLLLFLYFLLILINLRIAPALLSLIFFVMLFTNYAIKHTAPISLYTIKPINTPMRVSSLMVVIVLLVAIFPPLSLASSSQDIIVESYQIKVIRDANIKLTGNIIVKDHATLYISYSAIHFLGNPWQYGIKLYRNSTLKILYSKITSDNEINFVCENSSVYIENSHIELKGLMNGTAYLNIKNTDFSINTLNLNGEMNLNNSVIYADGYFSGVVSAERCYFDGSINLDGRADIYVGDVLSAFGGEWYIYRGLNLTVVDKYGKPLEMASVNVKNFFDGNVYGSGVTSKKGTLKFVLLSDYINGDEHFVGVYNITVSYGGSEFYKIVSLPNYNDGDFSSLYMDYTFKVDRIGIPQNPTEGDVVLSGNKTLRLVNGSFYYPSRIFLENGASLVLENAELIVDSSYGSVIAKEGSSIICKNSKIYGDIYLKNSDVNIEKTSLNGNIYSTGDDTIFGENSSFTCIYGYGNAKLYNSTASTVGISSVDIFGGSYGYVNSTIINATACSIEKINVKKYAKIYSVSYENISVERGSQVYLGYKLEVYVTNGHDREVENATVSIYENGTLIYQGRTDLHGKVVFYLYSARYENSTWIYDGNYRVVVEYKNVSDERNVFLNGDTFLHISFEEYLVPPLKLYLDLYTVPSEVEAGKEFILAGHAYYDNGEDAKNVIITVKIGKIVLNTTTDKDGRFSVKMPPLSSPGAYEITVSGNDTYNNLTTTQILQINVLPPPSFPWYYIIVGVVIFVAIVIVIRAVRIRRWKAYGKGLSA